MTNEEVTSILQKINEEAENFLKNDILIALKNNSTNEEEFKHRVVMDAFYASIIDVLIQKFPNIETFVEHDIPSWMESNASDIDMMDLKKEWDLIELKIFQKLSELSNDRRKNH